MRRMWRLPLGERWLLFTSALSSSPGHAPTHEERFLAEGKVAAVAPTSAMDLLCRICSQAGHLRQPLDCILMPAEESRHLLVELTDLLLDELQLFQRHLQQLVQLGAGVHNCAGVARKR